MNGSSRSTQQSALSREAATRIFFRIYQCDNLISRGVTRALDEYGLTAQQWAVLGALSRSKARTGMTVGNLSSFLKVSRQNVTGVLSRLEERKLIEKTVDEVDTRIRNVRLTPKGVQIWNKGRPSIQNYFAQMLETGSASDNARLLERLELLLDRLEADLNGSRASR
jgi:DNA-binding MarR family transcriptional regulator